jgi:retron-type reverse transcriptase
MNGPEKSDKPVVPMKSANSGASRNFWEFLAHLEQMEGRGLAKENEGCAGNETDVVFHAIPAKQADRTQSCLEESHTLDEGLHSALERVRQAACRDKSLKFTSLWHHVYNIDRLREAYFALKRNVAAGVDGETWQMYGQELESNLKDLSQRLVLGTHRAKPVKRVYIPKADGRQRPIGIPVLEDKIVQRAAVKVMNAIYETDFVDFSYGYRPGHSAHMALDALAVGIQTKKVSWLLDADIRGFFDTLNHEWLIKFVEHRIADNRVVRHIQKWLNAGVMEEGKRTRQEEGTPQGGSLTLPTIVQNSL